MQPVYGLRHGHRAAPQGKHEFFDAPAFIRVAFQEYQELDGPNRADLSMNKGQYFVFVQGGTGGGEMERRLSLNRCAAVKRMNQQKKGGKSSQ